MAVTVTRKGQAMIPKQVRDRLGITPGTKVDFEIGEEVVLSCFGRASARSSPAASKGCAGRRRAD